MSLGPPAPKASAGRPSDRHHAALAITLTNLIENAPALKNCRTPDRRITRSVAAANTPAGESGITHLRLGKTANVDVCVLRMARPCNFSMP